MSSCHLELYKHYVCVHLFLFLVTLKKPALPRYNTVVNSLNLSHYQGVFQESKKTRGLVDSSCLRAGAETVGIGPNPLYRELFRRPNVAEQYIGRPGK